MVSPVNIQKLPIAKETPGHHMLPQARAPFVDKGMYETAALFAEREGGARTSPRAVGIAGTQDTRCAHSRNWPYEIGALFLAIGL